MNTLESVARQASYVEYAAGHIDPSERQLAIAAFERQLALASRRELQEACSHPYGWLQYWPLRLLLAELKLRQQQ